MQAKDSLVGRLIAEFFGTAVLSLVFLSVGFYFNYTSPWYAAISVGATLSVLTLVLVPLSGAHCNPAYTAVLSVRRLMPVRAALLYVVVQLLAGLLAFVAYEFLSNTTVAPQSNSFDLRLLTAELIGAFVLGVIYSAVTAQKLTAVQHAASIGFGYFVALIMVAPAGLVFINPAIATAHGALSVTTLLAPLGGMLCGYVTYGLLFSSLKNYQEKIKA
jgi:glycerol uptake facilitator-like aquaporin